VYTLELKTSIRSEPIGKPGFNWESIIVDDNGRPVPRGKVGELIIRGPE